MAKLIKIAHNKCICPTCDGNGYIRIATGDTSKDFRLSTYASWWIRASIQDYILKNWSVVRTGSTASQKALFF